ncbi:hypothetical protein BC940DRAFT_310497 [Gongronella butleri]|nr:hypothetical protein BC940DRAFT_310497 [Gongronella butleri]
MGAVNIQFGYRGHGNAMDSSCVFTKIIVKSPQQGFTAPCKEGLVFISRKPIDIQKTRRFDGFTRADFDEYMKTINPTDVGDENPVAWFTIHQHKQAVVSVNERSGKYVLIKLLRSEHEEDNIDIQYIGFIGYTGPRSFASRPQLL